MSSTGGSVDPTPTPFSGAWEEDNKIVIGIDIGTTQTGVAFTFLQRGAKQVLLRVTKWPGQVQHNQQSKIPTLVWYDAEKKPVAFGAEALSPQIEEEAEDNGWFLARHFKLHLHPADMKAKHDLKLDLLPPGVSLRRIYSDFMGYLLKHTKSYFEDRIIDGRLVWERYKSTMEIVIAHPNGWGIREQTFLRAAAVDAGFADPEDASTHIRFVTEAEASVHFCIHNTNLGSRFEPGTNFAVCDAGGSTIDTTLYTVTAVNPVLKLEERRASACVQAGGIFVDAEAEKYLRKALSGAGLSEEDLPEYIKKGIKDFESFTKRQFQFEDPKTEWSIDFGNSRFNNPSIKTRRGRMRLPGSIVKSFFDVCAKEIVSSVDQQVEDVDLSYILLVGGFGDSPYLRDGFKKRYEPHGCQVALTNDPTSKAVADGAVIWSTIGSVSSRAPRYSFGVICSISYCPGMPEHEGRESYVAANGMRVLPGAWSEIVKKGVALDSQAVRRETYTDLYITPNPDLMSFTMDLYAYSGDEELLFAYRGGNIHPEVQKVCTISADLRNLEGALEMNTEDGFATWSLECDVCIRFGGTELEAYLEWKENGITRTGPVSIVPEGVVGI